MCLRQQNIKPQAQNKQEKTHQKSALDALQRKNIFQIVHTLFSYSRKACIFATTPEQKVHFYSNINRTWIMAYTISSEMLSQTFDATVHEHTVTLSNGRSFTFESDSTSSAFYLVHEGKKLPVLATIENSNTLTLSVNGYNYALTVLSDRDKYFQDLLKSTATAASGTVKVAAPMPGLIKTVNVQHGQHVKKGERLFILEAMKMENDLKAPMEGIIKGLNTAAGVAVEKGHVLCMIEAVQRSEEGQ